MKVCTKLTRLTMCTRAADAPCLGSLLYQTLHGVSQAHSQRLAVQDMSLIFMQASVLLHSFPRKRVLHSFKEQLFLLGSAPFPVM